MSTIIEIQESDRITFGPEDLNDNFASLNTGKVEITGNVATATALDTARDINGIPFDGSANVQVSGSLDNGLILYLPMDFASKNGTTFYDASTAKNSGTATLTGAFTDTDGPDGNGAQAFDGTDDYVEVPHHVNQLLVSGFTITAWIKVAGLGENSTGVIVDKSTGTSAQGGFQFRLNSTTAIEMRVNNGNQAISSDGAYAIGDGNWYSVAVTVTSGANVAFYANGTAIGTSTTGALSGITTTNAIRIGNRSTATDRSFNGSICKVRIYNRILTASELTQIYTNQL